MALGGLSLGLVSCDLIDDAADELAGQIKEVENLALTGSWEITSLVDSGEDETDDFAGFIFTFNEDGTVDATNGVVNYSGSWDVKKNSSDDDDESALEFELYFDLTNEFEELNDDWDILSFTSDTIELEDVSGGDGSVDSLTFSLITEE